MSDKFIATLVIISIVFLMFILQVLMPKLTRKEIYFGVRIPENQLENIELKKIYNQYILNNIIVLVPYITIIFLLLQYFSDYFQVLNNLSIIIYLIITFLIYFSANKKVREVKNKSQWNKGKKSVVVIDTNFTKEKSKNMLASPWWFFIPIIIIVINVIVGFSVYDKVPDIVATHFNFIGEADGWTKKSYKLILQMPGVQLFMTIILFFSYKIIGWSKQQISVSNPQESKEKNRIFRYRWSVYMIAMNIGISMLFTFGNLSILQVIKVSSKVSMVIIFIITMIIIVSSIIMSIKTGQGGSKIKVENKEKDNTKDQDRDDDKHWKLGNTIYVNKNDPSIFVEKRFGIGWTMNFGRTESIIIITVFIILTIALPILLR